MRPPEPQGPGPTVGPLVPASDTQQAAQNHPLPVGTVAAVHPCCSFPGAFSGLFLPGCLWSHDASYLVGGHIVGCHVDQQYSCSTPRDHFRSPRDVRIPRSLHGKTSLVTVPNKSLVVVVVVVHI